MRRLPWICALLALPWPVAAQSTTPPQLPDTPQQAESGKSLETPAQAAAKKLPRHLLNATPQRFSAADKSRIDAITRLDEITVYGYIEPEDYVAPKKAAMMQFRDQLERDRPMTPWEKIRLPLCLVGLCANYGPDGIPREPSLDERNKARINQSTTQLNGQFRSTVQ